MWYWYIIAGIIILVITFIVKRKKNSNNNDHNKYDNHAEPPSVPPQPKVYKPRKLDLPQTVKDKFLHYHNFRDFKCFERKDGFLFEDFVRDMFESLGYRIVKTTGHIQNEGNENDHGIDIIFENAGMPVFIQCKCYSNEVTYDDVKSYPRWKEFIAATLDCEFRYLFVTNNYMTPDARNYLYKNNIYCIELDQLRALYTLSENIDLDFSLTYQIKYNSYEYFTPDKFNKCNVGDELTFIVHTKSITIFNNAIKRRGSENNTLAKLSVERDKLAMALTTLYYPFTSELECKIIEKSKYYLALRIQLYKPTSEPVNDYSKLLNAIFPNNAA